MIYRGRSVFTEEPIMVTIHHDRIAAIDPLPNAQDLPYISPGFIDMQVNGYKGNDYSLKDFSSQHLENILHELACCGVTHHLPTIISSPHQRMLRTLRVIAQQRVEHPDVLRAIPGIHLEGPYLSHADGHLGLPGTQFLAGSGHLLHWDIVQLCALAVTHSPKQCVCAR